jgi:hypothetical protein
MNAKRAAAIGAALALISAVGIIWAVPSVDDFSLENPYWNGMSSAAGGLGISARDPGAEPDPAGTVLIIAGPDEPFSAGRVSEIASFLGSGGVVVLMDDFGEGNSLLEGLGVPVRINGSILLDPLFMEKARQYPVALAPEGSGAAGGARVTMDYASALEIMPGAAQKGARVLLESSAFSYLDVDGDGGHTAGEPLGPFPVAAEVPYGKGRFVVVSDSSILINSVYGISGGNAEFVRSIAGNREIVIDYGNNAASPYGSLRSGVLSAVGAVGEYPELRYLLAVAGAWAIFAADPIRLFHRRAAGGSGSFAGESEEVRKVAEAHPGWDLSLIRRTWEERARCGSSAPIRAAGSGNNPPESAFGRRPGVDEGQSK